MVPQRQAPQPDVSGRPESSGQGDAAPAPGSRHERLVASIRSAIESGMRDVEGGIELVDLSLRGSSKKRILRVDIDRAGPKGIDVDDCQRVSRLLGDMLESEDLIEAAYLLEVSSPGIDRPIETDDDYRRNQGRRVGADVEPDANEDGDGVPEHVVGLLEGLEAGVVTLRRADGTSIHIARERIRSIKQEIEF